MGKNNLILGTGRGKLGDIVFYRTGGEQRFRTRVRPTNPRTNAQLLQRCVVSTAVKFYSVVAEICNHAFQNYEGSLKNHQRFMKLNIDVLRKIALLNVESWSPLRWNTQNYGNYTWKNSQEVSINPYIVSEGDLEEVYTSFTTSQTQNGTVVALGEVTEYEEGNQQLSNLTYEEVADRIGVRIGDQVTMMYFNVDRTTGYITGTAIGRVVMMPSNGNPKEKFFDGYGINLPNKENYGNVTMRRTNIVALKKEFVQLTVTNMPISAKADAYAVIVSRFENNKWRRSTSRVHLAEEVENIATLKDAMASYLKDNTSSLYLNQAEQADELSVENTLKEFVAENEYEETEVQARKTRKNNKDAE